MSRILVTRPAAEAEATRTRLEALGHAALVEPMLTVRIREAAALPPGPFDAVVITSGNAVGAIAHRPERQALLALPLLAVGRRSAELARAAGFAQATSAGRDAAALAGHVARTWPQPRRILYLAGADRSTDLAAALAPLGHTVTTATVYDAIATPHFSEMARQAIETGGIDAVLHYSARTAEAFIACHAALRPLATAPFRHLCVSRKVAETLRSAGGRRILVAERPDEDALLALIA